ncbi:hypothetical protein HOP50_05g37700 [Chloropicon primus]|uniref:Uncharacterized protein n=2 Tax=Chloropicon primus TaxID=1764295 RepID=A0A5B8MLV2_9CHLO|nr:hypothetical protein A3770_05p37590 [Chloropicon primus]UPR00455.1 hypothetical protein HOP50_05g37700 [Chloropicon primus]|mmetsp:Transcript_1140/g.2622  ORF Transcript_1140/g.2622 Transcript_1140/m.2622 type:complete len:212 (+) Transcript_1140:593-1228(+)|eukprot:QDZ21241.1 hypothetical protein A3770_05p37590 [Chloropicon primus]
MTSSWQGSKAKYGSPVESTAVAAERERRLSVGSRSSGLDASAPIWTPPPKQSQGSLQWSRQAHSPVSPISPHGFSGESQMYAMQQSPYQYQYHQHQQQSTPPHGSPYGNRGRGVQRGLKYHHHQQQQQQQQQQQSFSPPPYYPGNPQQQHPQQHQQQQSFFGGSPSSPGTGVFLPSSLSRRQSNNSLKRDSLLSESRSEQSDGFCLPDELF